MDEGSRQNGLETSGKELALKTGQRRRRGSPCCGADAAGNGCVRVAAGAAVSDPGGARATACSLASDK